MLYFTPPPSCIPLALHLLFQPLPRCLSYGPADVNLGPCPCFLLLAMPPLRRKKTRIRPALVLLVFAAPLVTSLPALGLLLAFCSLVLPDAVTPSTFPIHPPLLLLDV